MPSNETKLATVCILIIAIGCFVIWHTQKRIQEEIWWADTMTPHLDYFDGVVYGTVFYPKFLTKEEVREIVRIMRKQCAEAIEEPKDAK